VNLVLYRSRVWRSFHWLPTLALPLVLILVSMAQDIAFVMATKFDVPTSLTSPHKMFFLPLVLGLGSIGRDASGGLLPVLLTRPVRRSTYVLSHWAALGTVASFWTLLHLLAQGGLLLMCKTETRGTPFYVSGSDLLLNGLDRVSLSFGMAAALVAFATRLPAFGNIVLWSAAFYVTELVLPGYGEGDPFKLVFTLRELLSGLLLPVLDVRRTFDATPISWSRLFTYLSNLSLWLLLAIHVFNSREVSYASR
jgi:hypothetical protein